MDEEIKIKKVEYAFHDKQPSMDDNIWKPLLDDVTSEGEIEDSKEYQRFWIRACSLTSGGNASKWVVYGPLKGENQDIDISLIRENGDDEVIQVSTERNKQKGLKCCRIRVRVRVVIKTPRVTVKPPSITVRWQRVIPEITVKGPEIIVSDLPRLPQMDGPIPDHSIPDVGMHCDVVSGDTILFVQNAEKVPVDVWVMWKGVNLGPARIEAKTMRSLGKTGYPSCESAKKNIYIIKAEIPGGW